MLRDGVYCKSMTNLGQSFSRNVTLWPPCLQHGHRAVGRAQSDGGRCRAPGAGESQPDGRALGSCGVGGAPAVDSEPESECRDLRTLGTARGLRESRQSSQRAPLAVGSCVLKLKRRDHDLDSRDFAPVTLNLIWVSFTFFALGDLPHSILILSLVFLHFNLYPLTFIFVGLLRSWPLNFVWHRSSFFDLDCLFKTLIVLTLILQFVTSIFGLRPWSYLRSWSSTSIFWSLTSKGCFLRFLSLFTKSC